MKGGPLNITVVIVIMIVGIPVRVVGGREMSMILHLVGIRQVQRLIVEPVSRGRGVLCVHGNRGRKGGGG